MAIPTAYFGYAKKGLLVDFKNLSLNSPTSYGWDFGDGNESTEREPMYTYLSPGFYEVTLITSNADGISEPFKTTIGVGEENEIANQNLPQLIDDYMPAILLGSASIQRKATLINKWQLYLQPLVYLENPDPDLPPYTVSVEDTHNEYKWPALFNYLIAQLCAYDIVLQGMNRFLSLNGNITTEMTNITEATQGGIKAIETGPTKTEWYEDKPSEVIKEIGIAYLNASKPGGPLSKLIGGICQFSARLRIYLPMCGRLPHTTIPPQVTNKPCRTPHNANPFGITKRMI